MDLLKVKLYSGGGGRWIRGKPDYALAREKDRKRLWSCRWLLVRHHNSNPCTLVLRIEADPREIKYYAKDWTTLFVPHSPTR